MIEEPVIESEPSRLATEVLFVGTSWYVFSKMFLLRSYYVVIIILIMMIMMIQGQAQGPGARPGPKKGAGPVRALDPRLFWVMALAPGPGSS